MNNKLVLYSLKALLGLDYLALTVVNNHFNQTIVDTIRGLKLNDNTDIETAKVITNRYRNSQVSYVKEFGYKYISTLPRWNQEVNRLEYKQILDFTWCGQITDLSFLGHTPNLQTLDLSSCRQIADLSFLTHAPNLQTLKLSYCKNITNKQIQEAKQQYHNLNILN